MPNQNQNKNKNKNENKTQIEAQSAHDYLASLEPQERREDGLRLLEIYQEETQTEGLLWTGGMVGFGHYHYKYATGREGDAFMTGFAMRKPKLSLYLYIPDEGRDEFLSALGKCTAGVSCVYTKRLKDINEDRLRQAIRDSLEFVKQIYPDGWHL